MSDELNNIPQTPEEPVENVPEASEPVAESSQPAQEVPSAPQAVPYQQPQQDYQAQQPANPYQQPQQGYQAQQPTNPYQQPQQGYQAQQPINPYQQPQQGYQAQQPINPYQQPQPGYQAQQPTNPYQQQSYTSGYYQYTPVNPNVVNAQNETDGFAVASGILSIVGLLTCCTFIPSLLAVIFGIVSKSKNDGTRPTGWSTAGIIMGVIGMILSVFMLMLMFAD